MVFDLVGLAIGVTRVVHESGDTVAVDRAAVIQREEIRLFAAGVKALAFLFRHERSAVFDDAIALLDGMVGVNAGGVDITGTNDEAHGYSDDMSYSRRSV